MNARAGQMTDDKAAKSTGLNDARSGSPERLAGFPKRVFTRDSNVIQKPVVQRAQLLPSTPAIEPNLYGAAPIRSNVLTGLRRRTGATWFLNK
jgi:hypothetical protein